MIRVLEDIEERRDGLMVRKRGKMDQDTEGIKLWEKTARLQVREGWFCPGQVYFDKCSVWLEASSEYWTVKQISKKQWDGLHCWLEIFWLQLAVLFTVVPSTIRRVSSEVYVCCWLTVPLVSTCRFCKSIGVVFLHHFAFILIIIGLCCLLYISWASIYYCNFRTIVLLQPVQDGSCIKTQEDYCTLPWLFLPY